RPRPVARDPHGALLEPLRPRGDHAPRRAHPAGRGRARQPGEGRGGTGAPEPEPDARLARELGAPGAREPVVKSGHGAPSARTVAREPRAMSAPLVLKLGGRALEAPDAAGELAAEVAALRVPVVIVHGGGVEVSAWCMRLGLAPRFVEGLRVTDDATLEVVAAVLAGLANKRLVAALRAAGVDAVGLAALAGGTVTAA